MNKTPLITVSGPSGGGKDSSLKIILPRRPQLGILVTTTTRPPRVGELNGVNYHFRSQQEFIRLITEEKMFEWVKSKSDRYYGTEILAFKSIWSQDNIPIVNIDLSGVKKIRECYPDTLSIFVMPRKLEELEERIRARGDMSENEIQKRLELAEQEMVSFKECCDAAFPVSTGKVDVLVSRMLNVIDPYIIAHSGNLRIGK